MPEIIKNLTDKFLSDIKPKSTNQIFRDKHRTYLKLVVRPSGSKSFYYRAKQNGKDLKRKIGDASTMNLTTARLIADNQHSGVKNGSREDLAVSSRLGNFTINCMFELYRDNELRHRRTVAGRSMLLRLLTIFM
ncbi:MAG: Arm DNA-binding domain-containing protein [Pseudomonadota bacterium]|nr:Arm DNA-binding domain-containing protein [Pseudomonadota bacterium]